MPPVSQAQRRWAFANRKKKTAEGKAAAEFAAADKGGKLPEKVKDGKPAKSRGERWYGNKEG
jgi:hypothetical protein